MLKSIYTIDVDLGIDTCNNVLSVTLWHLYSLSLEAEHSLKVEAISRRINPFTACIYIIIIP